MTSGGKKDPTYVEDVFSTHLYTGNGQSQTIDNGIKLGNANAGSGVEFDASSSQYLKVPQHSSLELGTGDYCIECWVRPTSSGSPNEGIWTYGSYDGNGGMLAWFHGNELKIFCARTNANICQVNNWRQQNVWKHLAVARYSGTTKTFSNGVEIATSTEQNNDNVGEAAQNQNQFFLGCERSNGNNIGGYFEGNISNMRIVKGSAVYTSNFTPPTKGLTNTTNTIVLFCQSSTSATTATKTPITITSNGDPTASGFGPFTATDGEGGMTWIKSRTNPSTGMYHHLLDSERAKIGGFRPAVYSNTNEAQNTYTAAQYGGVSSFNYSGFTISAGSSADDFLNANNYDYTSWTWRKQKGFFDIVTYTGDGTDRQIAHSLGSVPGAIFLKRTDQPHNWGVYHRGLNKGVTPEKYRQRLNIAGQEDGNNDNGKSYWNNTAPTSTHFTVSGGVSNNNNTNVSGATYVAYIFAGGESTADTARSVSLSGSSTRLVVGPSSDFSMGTGDFTIECWVKQNNQSDSGVWQISTSTTGFTASGFNSTLSLYDSGGANGWVISGTGGNSLNSKIRSCEGAWTHLAYVRSSGVGSLYVNGVMSVSGTLTTNFDGTYMGLGGYYSTSYPLTGNISNLRVVKGQALYTSSFTPTYEPLTTTSQGAIASNVKLLCFNNASVTGATVTPGTITAVNNPTASTDNPFDDPAGYKFGEAGDQNLIKCGNFVTDSSNGAILNLPWEPQWLLYKQNNANNNWVILDNMRGWSANGFVEMLYPNTSDAGGSGNGYEELLNRDIKFQGYGNNYDFMYIAIRRPDGLVGKPVEVGTTVFGMTYGSADSGTPQFRTPTVDVNDFSFYWQPASGGSRYCGSRLLQSRYWYTNSSGPTANDPNEMYDFMNGFGSWTSNGTSFLSYVWKRHAGFDVMCWLGNDIVGRQIPHNLGRAPEMIWIKKRTQTGNWIAGHIGMNGGINPWQYTMQIDSTDTSTDNEWAFNDTAPTNIAITLGNDGNCNTTGQEYTAMLFSSVDGVSKCGYYDGTGAAGHVITTGFLPRLLIIKNTTNANSWFLYDTVRGLGAGNDPYMQLENSNAQASGSGLDVFTTSSTGFTINQSYSSVNASGAKYIYYAHA